MRIIIILLFCALNSNAQNKNIKYKKNWGKDITDNAYAPKRFFLSANINLPALITKKWSALEKLANYNYQTQLHNSIKIEYAINKEISIGLGYALFMGNANWAVNNTIGKLNVQQNTILSSAQLHMFSNKKLDLFLNGELGYSVYKLKIANNNVPIKIPEYVYYFGGIGMRYFIIKRLALNAIGGAGATTNAQLGLCYRFGL